MQQMSEAESHESRTNDAAEDVMSARHLSKLRTGAGPANATSKADQILQLLDHVPFTPTQGVVRTPSPRSPTVRS